MRVITAELDEFKKSVEPNIMIMSGRLEQVETKAADLWHSVEDLSKKTGGQSGSVEEQVWAEIKTLQNNLFSTKSNINKRIDEIQDEIESAFAMCSNDVVEAKLTERMNEAIQLLTRQSADRIETKKTLRVLEKQIKNVFDITTFILSNQ